MVLIAEGAELPELSTVYWFGKVDWFVEKQHMVLVVLIFQLEFSKHYCLGDSQYYFEKIPKWKIKLRISRQID